MNTIPLISSDSTLLGRVAPLVGACQAGNASVVWIASAQDALDYLASDLPDHAIIDFSDRGNDHFALLNAMLGDSWLLHSNIIAWCADHDTCERLEAIRGANIVVPLVDEELEKFLPRILENIVNNQRILFQRTIGADLVQTVSGSYVLGNNLLEAHCYANLLCNYLYNANKIDAAGKMHTNLALTEMLINAIEHGNCGISYQEKGAWLDDGNLMSSLIEKKCQDPAIRDRRVVFEYTITPEKSRFFIADEGEGFNWRSVQDPAKKEHVQELHGRGIKLTRKYTKNLTYNEKGNEASFEIDHLRDCANTAPALFQGVAPTPVKAGDVIFREGEGGDFLYYIAKGRYEVSVKGQVVDELSPDDIFMGEMSFLLNNRRSATVRAVSEGALLRISKKDFVEVVKVKPQYARFLARLLARRLARRNTDASQVLDAAP